ncbi:Apc membrane recruitment protein 1 [Plakobranchus ocellatus]|uniref:Apc membrane recruitment protein 1 n=1 Tax=Plakobranchus ocellatus TaxID=259542 RepID=A0AAV4DIZ4_9GAST|nr:Apc membrane recruitment protein 1 [Plakobranchus ocellatus]
MTGTDGAGCCTARPGGVLKTPLGVDGIGQDRTSKARKGKAKQDKASQGKTRQGKTRQYCSIYRLTFLFLLMLVGVSAKHKANRLIEKQLMSFEASIQRKSYKFLLILHNN